MGVKPLAVAVRLQRDIINKNGLIGNLFPMRLLIRDYESLQKCIKNK